MVKITCSILCHNYGRFLAQAIESCLHQELGDYKMDILVIDDGSTDETPEVCARYAGQIRVVRSANEGFGKSLTKAIQLAEGDYVCLLDADDYLHPKKLTRILPLLDQGVLLVRNAFIHVNCEGHIIDGRVFCGSATSGICLQKMAAITLLPVMNERMFMPLDQPGRSSYLSEGLTYYRVHSASMQRNRKAGAWQSELAMVNRQFILRIDELLIHPPDWLASPARLKELRRESNVIAAFCELEAALQLGQRKCAFRRYGIYFWITLSQGHFTVQVAKMLVRTLFGMPNFKTEKQADASVER